MVLPNIPGISTGGGGLNADLGAGPSGAQSGSIGGGAFTGGVVNMGSKNGVPTWLIVGGVVVLGFMLFRGKKSSKK